MTSSVADDNFGEWVRGRRRLLELSLRQVSEQVNLSNAELAQIERGLRIAGDDVRARLIAVLGKDEPSP